MRLMTRDFHILSGLFILTASLAMLFGLLWWYDQKTTYIYLPYVAKEYYPVEKPYIIERPIILPCPGEMRILEPWREQGTKKRMAKDE
jgi:hypothetical protein